MTEATCAICDSTFPTDDDTYFAVVEDRGAVYSGYNVALEDDPDAGHLACQRCSEDIGVEGDSYVIVSPRYPDDPEAGGITTTRLVATGTVVATSHRDDGSEVEYDDPEFQVVSAWVRGKELPTDWFSQFADVPDDAEWQQLGSGWHSSMERSEVSDKINALVNGDVGVYAPVVVKFGQTRNVCSTNLTVYAPEGAEYWSKSDHERRPFSEYLKGSRSVPGGSFGGP